MSGGLPGINRPMLVRQTDVGQAVAVDVGAIGLRDLRNYVSWSDTAQDGEVTIEVADDPGYTGSWSVVQVFPFLGPNRQDSVVVAGGAVGLRHRITKSIVGGTVTTKIVGGV